MRVSPWTSNEVETNTRLIFKLYFAPYNGSSVELYTAELRPDGAGYTEIDVSSIVDAALQFHTTNPTRIDALDAIDIHPAQSGKIYATFSMLNDYEGLKFNDGTSLYTYDSKFVIKAGLSKGNHLLQPFFDNYLWGEKSFLRYKGIDEQYYPSSKATLTALAYSQTAYNYLYLYNREASIKIKRREYYLDGTNTLYQYSLTQKVKYAGIFTISAMPVNINNANLWYWEVEVELSTPAPYAETWTVAKQKFYPEKTVKCNNHLFFVNSLGALDSLPLLEIDKLDYEYDKVFAEVVNGEQFLNKNIIAPDHTVVDVRERAKPSYITPLLPYNRLQHFRDLMLSHKCFILSAGGKFQPFIPDEDSLSIATQEHFVALGITVKGAVENINYSPDNVSGEYTTCPKPLSLSVEQVAGDTIEVFYQFEENIFEGTVTIVSDIESKVHKVYGNSGSIRIYNVNGTVLVGDKKQVDIYLAAKCGLATSTALTIEHFYIFLYMAPFVANAYAFTYKGAGARMLTFQDGMTTMAGLITQNNAGVWQSTVEMISGTPATATKLGSAGGTFTRIDPPGDPGMQYEPPTASFVGIDKLEFFVVDSRFSPPGTTARTPATLYVNVSDGFVGFDDGAGSPTGSAVYVTLEKSETDYVKSPDGSVKFNRFYLQFYSDPHKINPLDVTGLGLSVTIRTEVDDPDSPPTYNTYTPLEGVLKDLGYLPTEHKDPVTTAITMRLERFIEESPSYYII